jgi:ADP-dependent NAD(P)H-hydrate dehydratase / NAD(P)H-hydrate epimerase
LAVLLITDEPQHPAVPTGIHKRQTRMKHPVSAFDHLPADLFTATQVRELDQRAMQDEQIPAFELMCRAGHAAFACLLSRFPETLSVCVLAGPGNNGGDGYVLSALAIQHDLDVALYTVGDHSQLSGASDEARQMALVAGVVPQIYSGEFNFEGDLIVDALLGTGLNKAADGLMATLIEQVNASPAAVLALDIPTGLLADSGCALLPAVRADATVTFVAMKQGLLTADGPDFCGELAYSALDIRSAVLSSLPASVERISYQRLLRLQQGLAVRHGNVHKGRYGHVLVVGGDDGMAGAAAMAVEAAARTGAGLVSCATRPAHAAVILGRRPEVMVKGVVSGLELLPLLERASVIAIGPGLGLGSWGELLLQQVLHSSLPAVIDADALNLLASPGWRRSFERRSVVLTPHPGEAARLLDSDIATVQNDRFAAARQLAGYYAAVVVLKGQGTVIAHPDGRVALCSDGNPGMASGGMGDVLTGVVAALMAQGMDSWQAARWGVCLHSAAADKAAAEHGSCGLLATDLMGPVRRLNNTFV